MLFSSLAGIESTWIAIDSVVAGVEAKGTAAGAASGVVGVGFFLKNENMETFYNQAIV
jgi:hypothetical protein